MAQIKRESAAKQVDIGTGPYLAKVVGHLDKSFMGGLEVTLLRKEGNTVGDSGQTYSVKYAPPFYGSTAFEFMGYNVDDYNDTQKSYGMWFTPPDVGVTVLVVFIDGRADEGYWLACVPGRFMNHMIPAIAATESIKFAEGDEEKYDVKKLPSAEVNRRATDLGESLQIEKIPRAVHPIAEHFLEQGTLADTIRGITESTSRRNVPNLVFGISTPGPLDRREGAKKSFIGKTQSQSAAPVPVSRLGGSQFVMDDGDDRYQRKKSPSEGPMEYVDLLENEDSAESQPEIPKDEYVRIRTRTGHQLLMHNSEDLIYIGNSRGTTWIELTSDGKIDIFAEDSISIHTKQDLNIRADRDINMEAGRNVNVRASGKLHTESGGNTEIIIGANGSITTSGSMNMFTGAANFFSAGTDTHILSGGSHYESAATINMNGAPAAAASPASALSLHANEVVDPTNAAWKEKRYKSDEQLQSILKRIPMHEPWSLHEHLDPLAVKPDKTDRG